MKTRDPLRVDESYYINNDPNYSAFADAITDVGPAPCQKFECSNRDVCAAKMVECKAFRVWTNEGEDVYENSIVSNVDLSNGDIISSLDVNSELILANVLKANGTMALKTEHHLLVQKFGI